MCAPHKKKTKNKKKPVQFLMLIPAVFTKLDFIHELTNKVTQVIIFTTELQNSHLINSLSQRGGA